jgi:hypothetical protein
LSNGNYISDHFRTGVISKDRTFVGESITRSSSDDTRSNVKDITKYNIDGRFVGYSSFIAKLSNINCSEISEDYLGQIDLNRDLKMENSTEIIIKDENYLIW